MSSQRHALSRFPACLLAFALVTGMAHGAPSKPDAKNTIRMYRYINEKGAQVTGSSISPEYARKGYQIVNMSGVVLETIPPEPTAEERAKLAQDEKNKLSAAQQLEHDKELLLRYTTKDDLQSARTRKLAEIDNKITMLQGNISSLNQQIAQEQQNAAGFERDGRPVPQPILTKLAGLQQELKVTESQQALRKQELVDETARFDHEMERFIYLEEKRLEQDGHAPAGNNGH